MNPNNKDIRITFRRPHVSARKPQQCELTTIPKNPIELTRPCSYVVKCKSHLAYGKTILMLIFSIAMPNVQRPLVKTRNILNFPWP